MCSRKWLMPFSEGASKRDPTRICASSTVRCMCIMGTATRRRPLGRTLRTGFRSDSCKGIHSREPRHAAARCFFRGSWDGGLRTLRRSGVVRRGLGIQEAFVDADLVLVILAQPGQKRAQRLGLGAGLVLAQVLGLVLVELFALH